MYIKMFKITRRNLFSGCVISCLCLLLLFASRKYTSTDIPFIAQFRGATKGPELSDEFIQRFKELIMPKYSNANYSYIIKNQRSKIVEEMSEYEYPKGKFNNQAARLSHLTPESGGTPIRSIIITTWRSGSTFLGDILNAMPGNFYHYEPLLNYDIIQIRGPPYAKGAIRNLKKLLNCDYYNMEDYLDYGKSHNWLFSHNTRLWEACEAGDICWEPSFLNEFCRLFPLQSMKVVRLRLKLAEMLLADKKLNVRIVLLIRDPRGTIQSRKHRDWCPGNPDCDRPSNLCRDMVADYKAAKELQLKYPDRFRSIRYEDFSLDLGNYVRSLFNFLGLPVAPSVVEFLETHTTMDIGGVSSTFRNSKAAPFHWKQDLMFSEIRAIEEECTLAMSYWKYKIVENETVLSSKDWSPLGELRDKDIGLLLP